MCSWLGIQETYRKVQYPPLAPGEWAGTVTNIEGGVHRLVYQDIWDNNWRLISELAGMEREGKYGMYRARMEYIMGFLVYISSTYRDRIPYLKGVHLTMDSWILSRDKEGWRLRRKELNMADVEGKWQGIEDADKTILVMGVPRLKFDLIAMGILNEYQTVPQRKLREQRLAVTYIMGDASALRFGLVLWGQGKLVSESREFTPLHQGRPSNFR